MSVQASQRTLRLGDTGSDVRTVQVVMNSQHCGPLVEDGIFGPKTQAAVKKYQGERGLVADGIVGPKTWARINHDLN
jgi:peptidoglycan hydrolase-like protein with peptidoglycan-binding domain